MLKICPILKAGTMLNAVHTETGRTTVHHIYSHYPTCIGEDCAWFENGCPAYHKPKKVKENTK